LDGPVSQVGGEDGERCGFGKVPAIVVIDLFLDETDKTGESSLGSDLDEAVEKFD